MTEYLQNILSLLERIEEEEKESIAAAAKKTAQTIENDGLIYVFGCGHSHLPGLDAFYRAGGLGNIAPMLDTDLMLHNGAAKSSRMEKMSGIAPEIFRRYKPGKKDLLFLISASGKNRVPVEMAECAKKAGVFTIGISSAHYEAFGGTLLKAVDLPLDSKVPYGDASVMAGNAKMGPLSTYAACFLLESCLIEGARICAEKGVPAPVFMSGNVEGGKEFNLAVEEKYLGRVKHL